MTRRGGLLTAATATTLLLTAWVSSAGPIGVFARPDLTEFRAKAPGEDYGPKDPGRAERATGHTAPRPDSQTLVGIIDWLMKALVVLVVLAVLVAVARVLVERWRSRELHGVGDEAAAARALPEALLRQARQSEELLATGTPGNAVIAAWVGLEEAVRSAGVRDDSSRTSEELVTTVLRSYAVDRGSLDVLAALYREARFSRHEVTEAMREQARVSLQQVQVDLRRELLAHAGATTSAPRGRSAR